MARNYLDKRGFDGYQCYRLFRDRSGNFFDGGPKYVVFVHGILFGEFDTERDSEAAFRGESTPFVPSGIRIEDYVGLNNFRGRS